MLKMPRPNAKLRILQNKIGGKVTSLDLLAGVSCPGAALCKSRVSFVDGKPRIKDGPACRFRCFSASQEVFFPATYAAHKHNLDSLRVASTPRAMSVLIQASIPKRTKVVRLHVSGDFFSQAYFDAIILTARAKPNIVFYCYTKSLPYWVKRIGSIPSNFRLTASKGGKYDHLIEEYNLPYSEVVFSEAEAEEKGLPLDNDDSHAYNQDGKTSFALLLHGIQPIGTPAAKALQTLKSGGHNGYKRQTPRN